MTTPTIDTPRTGDASTATDAVPARRMVDRILVAGGLLMTAVLIVAGGLLFWGHSFVSGQVHDQLAAEKIFFPPAGSDATAGPEFAAMRQYAGQQMTTGAQAEVYANHFIAVHLTEIGGGKTYSELSAASMADPKNAVLAGQVATVFKGETLRGLLLNAYAFGTMATIALIAAIGAFVAAALMLLLSVLGLLHIRRGHGSAIA